MAHVGLGTDGGARLPKTVEGYRNIEDLPKLVSDPLVYLLFSI
jgi:hypothetical protein